LESCRKFINKAAAEGSPTRSVVFIRFCKWPSRRRITSHRDRTHSTLLARIHPSSTNQSCFTVSARPFKRQVGEKMFVQPLAYKIRSGIPVGKWMQRALRTYQELDIHAIPMFCKNKGNARARVADLDFLFWDVLVRVQPG
jgi:hypothetical protein